MSELKGTLTLTPGNPSDGVEGQASTEYASKSTVSLGRPDSAAAVAITSESLLDLFKSKNVILRAWNTRIVLRKFQIVLLRCDSHTENTCIPRNRRRIESTSSEAGAVSVDTDSSSEETTSDCTDYSLSEDDTFNKSGDSDYVPSVGTLKRKGAAVVTRSKHRRDEAKRRRTCKQTRAVIKRKNRNWIVSSTDEGGSDFSPTASESRESSPVGKRARRRSQLATQPVILSCALRDRRESSGKVKLRKRKIPADAYAESGESSGKDDSDFCIDDVESRAATERVGLDSKISSDNQDSLQQPPSSIVESESSISTSNSPPLDALEQFPDSVLSNSLDSVWLEVEKVIRGPEETEEGGKLVTMTTSAEEIASSEIILSIPSPEAEVGYSLSIPEETQPTVGASEPSTTTQSVAIVGFEPIPTSTPMLQSLLRNEHTAAEQWQNTVDGDHDRRDSSDAESEISISELYSTLAPETAAAGPVCEIEEEDTPLEIIADIGGKICPYCWHCVPCFKLEMHGSLFHGKKELAPFLYSCRFCQPEEPFQTLVTLIDHIEIRHKRSLSVSKTPVASSSQPKRMEREPGLLRMPNIDVLSLRNHLAGVMSQNPSLSQTNLPRDTPTHMISYFPSNRSAAPIVPRPSSSRQLIQSSHESVLILTSVCRAQITESLKVCNFPTSQVTTEMGMAIRNETKEALKRILCISQQQQTIFDNPRNIDPKIAAIKEELHAIVLRIVLAQKLRNGAMHTSVSPTSHPRSQPIFEVSFETPLPRTTEGVATEIPQPIPISEASTVVNLELRPFTKETEVAPGVVKPRQNPSTSIEVPQHLGIHEVSIENPQPHALSEVLNEALGPHPISVTSAAEASTKNPQLHSVPEPLSETSINAPQPLPIPEASTEPPLPQALPEVSTEHSQPQPLSETSIHVPQPLPIPKASTEPPVPQALPAVSEPQRILDTLTAPPQSLLIFEASIGMSEPLSPQPCPEVFAEDLDLEPISPEEASSETEVLPSPPPFTQVTDPGGQEETPQLPVSISAVEEEDEDDFECYYCENCDMNFLREAEVIDHIREWHGARNIVRV